MSFRRSPFRVTEAYQNFLDRILTSMSVKLHAFGRIHCPFRILILSMSHQREANPGFHIQRGDHHPILRMITRQELEASHAWAYSKAPSRSCSSHRDTPTTLRSLPATAIRALRLWCLDLVTTTTNTIARIF